MSFHSLDFVAFLLLVTVVYWRLSHGAQNWFLLGASYLFYGWIHPWFCLLLGATTLVDWYAGLRMQAVPEQRRRWLVISVVSNLGMLGFFKYWNFFTANVAEALDRLGLATSLPVLQVVLPVGISFYTFQSLSYSIDVYRGRLRPTPSLRDFALFVSFFPQLVAGPIVRAKEFLWQFGQRPKLSTAGAQTAVYLILRGMVKKVAIADFLATRLIDRVFDNPGAFSSTEVIVAVYAYTWQLYGDFSGYTDIARGSARLLGYELPENFDRPFNTTGPIEFWRNWHITLSRWVQDYIYIPLGGSQKGEGRTYANLFLAFFIIGVWHGAGWTFVIFGLWHATGVTLNRLWRAYREKRGLPNTPPKGGWKRALLVFISVHFFVVHWPIFRGNNLANMLDVYEQMFAGDWAPVRVGAWVWAVIFGMAFVHFCPRRWVDGGERRILELPWPLMGVLVAVIGALLMHISAGQAAPFIYFQF